MNAYMNQYQSNHVATASREQILIMLYEGAIRFLRQASTAMAEGDRGRQMEFVNKATAIISELSATLDHQVGGEIAANLDALYGFMNRELIRGNLRNDPKPLKLVEEMLSDLRETWSQAIEIQRRSEASSRNAEVSTQASMKPVSVSL